MSEWYIEYVVPALEADAPEAIAQLKALGAKFDYEADEGRTALIVAAKLGRLRAIQQLAALGANLNYENMIRQTALVAAAEAGAVQACSHLVNLGADVNHVTAGGMTAVMHASQKGMVDVISALAAVGASLHQQTTQPSAQTRALAVMSTRTAAAAAPRVPQNTALISAVIGGQKDSIHALVDSAETADFETADGLTALIQAAKMGQVETIKLLLERGRAVRLHTRTHHV